MWAVKPVAVRVSLQAAESKRNRLRYWRVPFALPKLLFWKYKDRERFSASESLRNGKIISLPPRDSSADDPSHGTGRRRTGEDCCRQLEALSCRRRPAAGVGAGLRAGGRSADQGCRIRSGNSSRGSS